MGNPALGSNTSVLIGTESAFKTADLSAAHKIPVDTPTLKKGRNKSTPKSLTGRRQPRKVIRGKGKTDGAFNVECNPLSVGEPYRYGFGSREDFGTSDLRATRYTLGPVESFWTCHQHPDSGVWFLGEGNAASQLTWSFADEGAMMLKFAYMGARRTTLDAAPVASEDIVDDTRLDPLDYFLISVKKNGVKLGFAKSEEITLNNNVTMFSDQDEDTPDEQAGFSTDPPTLSGKVTAYFDSRPLFDEADEGDDTELDIWVPHGLGLGHRMVIPAFQFLTGDEDIPGNGPCSFVGDFDAWDKNDIAGEHRSRYLKASDLAADVLSGTTLVFETGTDLGALTDTTVTFLVGDTSLAAVIARINAAAPTLFRSEIERPAGDPSGVIRAIAIGKGDNAHFKIKSTSTAAALLGFETGRDCPGKSAQSIVVWVMWK